MKNRSLPLFLLAGLLSSVLCTLGPHLLPEGTFLLDMYPGVVLGTALYLTGYCCGLNAGRWRAAQLLVIVVATVAGWRLSINVGYEYGQPFPYIAAGALGALTTALGLLWPWTIRRGALGFVLLATASGALGGFVFQEIEKVFTHMTEDVWALVLFFEWQTIFMLGTWLACRRVAGK
jgi:hypothetical protein